MNRSRIAAALLLAAGLALAPSAHAAFDAYLKLEGVEGESTDAKHRGEIEVDSSQLGSLQGAADRASKSSGPGAAKVSFNPFSITKKVDKASPVLFKACASGKHFPSATITMRKAGGSQQEYLVVKMYDVLISSYRTSGVGASQTESFVVNAANATLENMPTPRPGGAATLHAAPAALQSAVPQPTAVPTPQPKTRR
jgi:type VI secretion system secreted protein Hcp